jgi:hypothetical protein
MTDLTDNQRALILLAVETEGRVDRYPENLQGGARTSVMRGLLRNELVEPHDAGYRLTETGWAAAGYERPADTTQDAGHAGGDNGDHVSYAAPPPTAAPKQNRLDLVVGLLSRPEGATIPQIMAETNWQAHSVRGFFAGTVRKKGYPLTSSKEGKEERVYRIQKEAAPAGNATE